MKNLLSLIDELEKLDAAATPGPWYHEERGIRRITICPPEDIAAEKMVDRVVEFPITVGRTGIDTFLDQEANAAFIAESRHALVELCQAVRDMSGALKDIARQKTVAEVEEEADAEFDGDGDMEGAYEMMIDRAREVLAKYGIGEKETP